MYHWLTSKWLCDLELEQKKNKKKTEAQLFEDRLVVTQGLDFNLGFFFLFIKSILSNYFL